MSSVSVLDVAQYILSKQPASITTMKLQKLVYYSQAWHLAWTGKELFGEDVQAWANGPVVKALFNHHRGLYSIKAGHLQAGSAAKLNDKQKAVIDTVLETYGPMSATQLSLLTHAEAPWITARGHLPAEDKSAATITSESMKKYYKALAESPEAVHDVAEVNFPAWA